MPAPSISYDRLAEFRRFSGEINSNRQISVVNAPLNFLRIGTFYRAHQFQRFTPKAQLYTRRRAAKFTPLAVRASKRQSREERRTAPAAGKAAPCPAASLGIAPAQFQVKVSARKGAQGHYIKAHEGRIYSDAEYVGASYSPRAHFAPTFLPVFYPPIEVVRRGVGGVHRAAPRYQQVPLERERRYRRVL